MLGHGLLNFPRLLVMDWEGGKMRRRGGPDPERPERTLPLYRLDWSHFDKRTRNPPERGKRKQLPPALPEPLDKRLQAATFALDEHYFQAIRKHAWDAARTWATVPMHMDTVMRDVTVGPAFSHMRVIFSLLGDCVYRKGTKAFDGGAFAKVVLPELMAYRFWAHQTGDWSALEQLRGLCERAGWDLRHAEERSGKLAKRAKRRKGRLADIINELAQEAQEESREALTLLREHREKLFEPVLRERSEVKVPATS